MSSSPTRLYVVTSTDDLRERIIRAGSKARAVRFAASARIATQIDLERLITVGVKVENTTPGRQRRAEQSPPP